MDKILVEIASYLDPDLLNTVASAMRQADYPERVFFAICYQGDDLRDYEILRGISNIKLHYLKESEIKGLCYARYLCQQMIEDEKYVYQVDSHMRFVKHWDTEMIRQLEATKDEKAMISFYPADFDETKALLSVDDVTFDQPTKPTINYPINFYEDSYFIKFDSRFASSKQRNKLGSPFMAAGNFFAFAEAHREVLHDPKMCWYGDELPMAIRYYTHGWNNYCPEKSYIYHRYFRKNRAIHSSYAKGKELEKKRLEALLGLGQEKIDLERYGLGKVRTLVEFEARTGVNFPQKTIKA